MTSFPSPRPRTLLQGLRWLLLLVALAVVWLAGSPVDARAQAQAASAPLQRTAMVVDVQGAIGPATAHHLQRALARAAQAGAGVVVLRIDTPGGLDSSMREMVQAVLASPVPVVGYVAPGGARAASAGTYLLYASHVAAMAPGTNLGAATPVPLGGDGGGARDSQDGAAASSPGRAAAGRSTSEAKAINDAVAYIRSLAELRGRNADWAEQAVRASASLSSDEAVARQVVDLQATSVDDLLRQLQGRSVATAQGRVTLQTSDLVVQALPTDWRTRLLGALANPNLALILMTLGVYGLLFEVLNPGALFPGVLGAISLVLGLYALAALPLSLAGAALLVIGLALMVAEGFVPSFGVLGIGGVLAFVFGAGMLIDDDVPGLALSMPLVAAVAVVALGFVLIAVRLALASRRQAQRSGAEAMLGHDAQVLDWSGRAGHVLLMGERWQATGPQALLPGQPVRVLAVQGLRVEVAAVDAAAPASPRST